MPFNRTLLSTVLLCSALQCTTNALAQTKNETALNADLFSKLKFRSIGPAVTSGRISDFAVHPQRTQEYYVASASGGVWKTTNGGITYEPIFDQQGSYSIGCVTLAPSNPSIVWVGTGENNNQRSVSYGDGVYKSEDGGKRFKHMGLKQSEHISEVIVHPTDPNIVYVGAYGPVWSEGGERGVYKSTDGGETWTCVKSVSPYTGVNDLVMDPRNPDVLYAAFHQRMRKVFTYIGGGPESALYKTTDGGKTWKKMEGGLPGGEIGRMGLAISPVNPDILYTVVEAPGNKGGIYRSTDQGQSWEKRSGFYTSGNYYQEIICDPKNVERIYITDTYFKISNDGGKTVANLGERNKHIDNHAIWIDPNNTNHLLVGCDGGIYETYDLAGAWHFKENLPVTQFYKVSTDNDFPFYSVHGGTQDNLSLGGPSRSTSANGLVNADWYVTSLGDGFETQVDPTNPNLIYAQSQYGGLVRFDRKNGEYVFIKPVPKEGEAAHRWNWDAPLLISQHQSTRLYFGANKIFRTDDRGNSWTAISPDLTRQVDRNQLPVMGKVWSVDAIAKNGSTDIFGQTTSIAESKLDENVLWVGTDDGLIQYTKDGGKNWTRIDNLPGAPSMSYVHQIIASLHDRNTAYVCFNHHRYGDFKPYVWKTTDAGKTWKAIQSNLPIRGSVYSIAEDHIDPNLLFVGTEFGVYFSSNGGGQWIPLKAGLPTVAVRDIEIQRRENDLVLATFGRGFYVLDDYSVLRHFKQVDPTKQAQLFPVKDAWVYHPRYPLGLRDKGHLGASYYSTPNPPVGAVIRYYLSSDLKTLKALRGEKEKQAQEKNQILRYPSLDSLRMEDQQVEPYLLFTITDSLDRVVRHIKAPGTKGLQEVVWDFRYNTAAPVAGRYTPGPDELFGGAELGAMTAPGRYKVQLSKYEEGQLTPLAGPEWIQTKLLPGSSLDRDMAGNAAFYQELSRLRSALGGSQSILEDLQQRVRLMETAILEMPAPPKALLQEWHACRKTLAEIDTRLNGDRSAARREFETLPSIGDRIETIQQSVWNSTAPIPAMYRESYGIASKQFTQVLADLKKANAQVEALEKSLDMNKAPYTPGRWPVWEGR